MATPVAKPAAKPVIAANNPLLNPNAQLSGNSLLQAGQALVNAQTQGPLADLARQIAQNNTQAQGAEKLTGGYFNQLGQQAQQGVQNEQTIGNGLNGTLTGIGNDTQSALRGIGDNAMQNFQRYTPQGEGAGLNAAGGASLAQEIARQQGLAAQNAGTFRFFGANQGANYSGLAAANQGAFAQRGQDALKGLAEAGQLKNEPLNQKIADLNATKGSLLSNAVGKLRQQEISNNITKTGLGIKAASVATTAANDRAKNALTARGQDLAARGKAASNRIAQINAQLAQGRLGETQRHNLATERAAQQRIVAAAQKAAGKGRGKPGLPQSRQNTAFGQIETARSLIHQLQGVKKSNGQPYSESDIRNMLQTGQATKKVGPLNASLVDAAYALNGYGYLTPAQVNELHNMGLTIGNRYKIANAPAPKKGGLGGAVNAIGQAVGSVF